RDDASSSPMFFQTSDATWQAYNAYGGNSLYLGTAPFANGHAAKVSYNRPFITRNGGGGSGQAAQDWLFNSEYPMVRFLEAAAYRTLVCYKEGTLGENVCGGKCDPLPNVWTGLWRDGCSFGSADGCRPENALTGQISWNESDGSIVVPSTYKSLRFWRNTSV